MGDDELKLGDWKVTRLRNSAHRQLLLRQGAKRKHFPASCPQKQQQPHIPATISKSAHRLQNKI
jgi:hypothetical protein